MKFVIKLFLIIITASTSGISQQNPDRIKVFGDSLVGKVINGESVREIYGNVRLIQGNVYITCDKAVQFLLKNDAVLNGNVVVKRDSLTITTSEGFYFGDERKTRSTSGIVLDDKKVVLIADSGEYYFDEDKAFFQSNVSLKDSVMLLTSDELTYYQKKDRAVSIGHVKIVDAANEIKSDTLEHFRSSKTSIADGHVRIRNLENNSIIFGNHLEDYPERKYTLINENPLYMQFDSTTTDDNELIIDTLLIKALSMEAFRDTANIFMAIDSVQIIKGEFASVNDYSLFLREDDIIITKKMSVNSNQPVLWYQYSQLSGDSITIYMADKKINRLDVNGDAFMLSQNNKYTERFDQTSAKDVYLYFLNNKLNRADFKENVLSIYYLYEDNYANGLTKSSAKNVTIVFENDEVSEVRLYGLPESDFYPENQVTGNEKGFTLPAFNFFDNRPEKDKLLNQIE
ncbi:OstA-like protein [Bacteroidota bacterium]